MAAGTADGGVEPTPSRTAARSASGDPRLDGSKGYKGAKTMSVAFGKRRCHRLRRRRLRRRDALPIPRGRRHRLRRGRPPRPLLPAHRGPVVDLAPARDGLLVSAAHDGTMRVWDLALAADGDRTPEVCYGLGGYKVWLGSVCVDDKRLISDGSDNTVVVHDFSKSD